MAEAQNAGSLATFLAVDWGSRHVGTATGNSIARMASPLQRLNNTDKLFDELISLVDQHGASRVLVGLPRNLDGEETAQSAEIRKFAEELDKRLQCPVSLQDETLSTSAGAVLLTKFPGADKDSLAATVFLQDFLDAL